MSINQKVLKLKTLFGKEMVVSYKNWKGIRSNRNVRFSRVWYGSTKYHKENQWLVTVMDLDKFEFRDFAVKDLEFIKQVNVMNKYKIGLKNGDLLSVSAEKSISDDTWTYFYNGDNRHKEENFVAVIRSTDIVYITKAEKK